MQSHVTGRTAVGEDLAKGSFEINRTYVTRTLANMWYKTETTFPYVFVTRWQTVFEYRELLRSERASVRQRGSRREIQKTLRI
jgi:hypothetical protein